MDDSTFQYLKPTETQMQQMGECRDAAKVYADALQKIVPEGADKDYALRLLRSAAMWVNIAITRYADGRPRT